VDRRLPAYLPDAMTGLQAEVSAGALDQPPRLDAAGSFLSGSGQSIARVWNFDIDLKPRNRLSAIHGDVNLVVFHVNVLGNDRHDFVPQIGKQIGLTANRSFMGQQNLQPFARNGRAATTSEQI